MHCTLCLHTHKYTQKLVGWDSVVGTATRYRLDSPGIKSRWGRDFTHPSILVTRPDPTSCTMGTVTLTGSKAAGAWRRTTRPQLTLRLKEQYSYSVSPLGLHGLFYSALHFTLKLCKKYRGADKSLARPTSRCRRTESIVSLERGVCSCAELQVFSCYRG